MQLSWSQPCSSGMIQLLLVSNLLLWECVVSRPMCLDIGYKKLFLQELFDRATVIAQYTSNLTMQMSEEFSDELLKVMISISRVWYHPLEHLVCEVAARKGTCETMLSKIKELEEKNQELLEEMKGILVRVHPGAEENAYPAWMGLAEVRSDNEDTHHFALSNLLHCLRSDTDKIVTYLEVLKCQVIHNNNC
ncbi:prolactin-like isoform X3 [Peromyscus maniculatus bairdii]|uniref:prolactin-like isoform X3 n=1 Tax=Peromyscus maniculatus bairdii TaxID=230844 RepID=UPI003FD2DEDA